MKECEKIDGCPFFEGEMARLVPEIVKKYKKQYCFDGYTHCARYIVARFGGREKVPGDLMPNEFQRAEEIINKLNNK